MKRFFAVLLILSALVMSLPATAQEAPSGVFLGTWDYSLPPEHHMNSFVASKGPEENLGLIYRQMVEMPPAFLMWATNTYEGLLAEAWGFVDDNTAYQIVLKDANWSNGEPVTADDVVNTYAIGRILGWAQFNYINDVQKVDDKTVKFMFSGDASLVAERLILKEYIRSSATYGALAEKALAVVADGATKEDEAWTALAAEINEFRPEAMIASGPYTYEMAAVSDSYLTLSWQPGSIYSGQVKFGELRIWKGETESTTPLVLNGDIAWATNVYPAATQQQFTDAGIRLITTPRGYGPALLFNHDVYPFNVKEVRQAAAYAINRDENAFFTNGFGATGTAYMAGILDSMVETLIDAESIAKLNRYEYNLDKAAEMMTAAGFTKNADGKWVDGEGRTVKAEYKIPAEFADFSGAGTNATEQLNAFGWDITLRAIPWQQTAEDIRNGDFELSVWSWAAGSPFATRQFYGPIQRFNYVDPTLSTNGQKGMNFPMEFDYNGATINLDKMINDVSGGLDLEAQKARAGEVALILNDLMPFVPLNVIISTEPWNETLIAGGPADGDPLLANPSSDHFVIWLLLNGSLGPAS